MERVLQYLDNVDDLYWTLGLIGERVRRAGITAAFLIVLATLVAITA